MKDELENNLKDHRNYNIQAVNVERFLDQKEIVEDKQIYLKDF